MNDLVEKIQPALVTEMMNAYFAASKTPYSYPPNVCDGFGAAAKVLLEAALGEMTSEEQVNTWNECASWPKDRTDWPYLVQQLLANRKARLLAPKTIESRVELRNETNQLGAYASVWLDGKHVITLLIKDAERYRRGLIAEMKEKGHGNQ